MNKNNANKLLEEKINNDLGNIIGTPKSKQIQLQLNNTSANTFLAIFGLVPFKPGQMVEKLKIERLLRNGKADNYNKLKKAA